MELPSLPERPRAEVFSVEDILGYARKGRLRVPQFQTGLRWESRNVVELFDSIVRGFPVGGLLLWSRPGESVQLSFGPVSLAAPPVPDALFLVDGQQRVTALVGALLHPDEVPLGGTHAVWVDLVHGSFAVPRARPAVHWLPLNILGDRTKLLQWSRRLEAGDATEALVARAFELEATVLKYSVPVYVVRDASPPVLRLIFARINQSGVPLDEAQVFQALFGEEQAPRPLAELAVAVATETRFGMLPEDWLLRCVKAVAGLDPRLEFSEHRPPSPELLMDARIALQRAVSFLTRESGFLHAAVLPYRFPLIVLARFFQRHPDPHPRNRSLLVRWVWRGALAGVHGNSSQASVAAHLADIGEDESASVQRLLARVPREVEAPDPMRPWNGHAAATRLYATLLLHLFVDAEAEEQVYHVLSQDLSNAALAQVFRPIVPDIGPAIAGRMFSPRDTFGVEDITADTCDLFGVDEESLEALRGGDRPRFLQGRAASLQSRMRDLIAKLAAPGENDRPPLAVVLATAGG